MSTQVAAGVVAAAVGTGGGGAVAYNHAHHGKCVSQVAHQDTVGSSHGAAVSHAACAKHANHGHHNTNTHGVGDTVTQSNGNSALSGIGSGNGKSGKP
ncbi:MAG: hypothetical protein NVS3B12_09390 [Acidimicrobiales bacterium]